MTETVPKKRVNREWAAQEIDWAFLMKALPYGALARGIDQAAKRSPEANRARLRRGCYAGTPDTYILWNGVTLWIERKAGEALTTAQKTFRDQVRANNGFWELAESTDDVEAACLAAGIPLRATLGGIRTRIAEQNERLGVKKKPSRPRKPQPRNVMGMRAYRKANKEGKL